METGKQLERLNRTKPGSSPALKSLIVVRQFNNNQIINNAKFYLHSAISSCSIELNKIHKRKRNELNSYIDAYIYVLSKYLKFIKTTVDALKKKKKKTKTIESRECVIKIFYILHF